MFGGGGGTITPEEIRELQAYGVERIYHPNDGMHMGLVAMIEDVVRRATSARKPDEAAPQSADIDDEISIGHMLSAIEEGLLDETQLAHLRKQWQLAGGKTPVVGITGTGGAGKSSVTDELLNRFLASFPEMRIAVISVDPTRRRTGGALLGDRIRMNSLRSAARLHALDGHAPPARGHQHRAQGLHRLPQGPGLRPGDRRDRRHRPVATRRSSTSSTSRCT